MWIFIIISIIIGFIIGFFVYGVRYYLKKTKIDKELWNKCIENALKNQKEIFEHNQKIFDKIKTNMNKKQMEEQLKLNLERDELLKKNDEETLRKLTESIK